MWRVSLFPVFVIVPVASLITSRIKQVKRTREQFRLASENEPLAGAKIIIVAAHHNEDIRWLSRVAKRCMNCEVYIYTSSQARAMADFNASRGKIREVPNVGREWGKYLRFISDEYLALQRSNATVAFVHAHQHGNSIDDCNRGNMESVLWQWTKDGAADRMSFFHGYKVEVQYGNPTPYDMGFLMRDLWPHLFRNLGDAPKILLSDSNRKDLDLACIGGAEFSVPAFNIVRNSAAFWQGLLQWLSTRTPALPPDPLAANSGRYDLGGDQFDYVAGSILELMANKIFGPGQIRRKPERDQEGLANLHCESD